MILSLLSTPIGYLTSSIKTDLLALTLTDSFEQPVDAGDRKQDVNKQTVGHAP